jgi:hypothetical protein
MPAEADDELTLAAMWLDIWVPRSARDIDGLERRAMVENLAETLRLQRQAAEACVTKA